MAKSAPPTVHTVFTRTSATYDAARAKLIPPYDRFYSTAVGLLPFDPANQVRILDLGAGTGLLSAFIREKFPNAPLDLVEIAYSMLDRARQRLGTDRTTYAVSDCASHPLEGHWHAIVSALSIHHLSAPSQRDLFRHIYSAL